MLLTITNRKTKKFLTMVYDELEKSEIDFKLTKKIDETFEIDGYFDDAKKKLVVVHNELWLETLVHEFSHYVQYKEQHPSFAAYYKHDFAPIHITEQWLKKKIGYNDQVKKSFQIIRQNEYECDVLGAKLIRQYELPIDLAIYKKWANRQLLFYHCVEHSRIWNAGPEFLSPEVLDMIPPRFQPSYIHSMPKRMNFLKVFFKEQ